MKLGVFDSGIGGEAIAIALEKAYPDATVIRVDDRKNIPYGDKSAEQIITFTDTAIQPLLRADCEVIVLACNTATAIALDILRDRYPNQKFIGIEPMVKKAATLTSSGVITVCATPATLSSARYKTLTETYTRNLSVLQPDCSKWASMIENNQINHKDISDTIESACSQGSDVIVLGCTHYHWIKDLVEECANGRAIVLEPSEAIAARIADILTSR